MHLSWAVGLCRGSEPTRHGGHGVMRGSSPACWMNCGRRTLCKGAKSTGCSTMLRFSTEEGPRQSSSLAQGSCVETTDGRALIPTTRVVIMESDKTP